MPESTGPKKPTGYLLPNGMRSPDGRLLDAEYSSAATNVATRDDPLDDGEKLKVWLTQQDLGPTKEVGDPNDLSQTGWGVVFPGDICPCAVEELKSQLKPLLELRSRQAGTLFRIFEGKDGYSKGESSTDWLERHGVSPMPVDPTLGVPFYLTIVGSPEQIPFEFQSTLDLYWGVGRLHFDEPGGLAAYAQSIVEYETGAPIPRSRSVAIFATDHERDEATQALSRDLARPLAEGDGTGVRGPIGSQFGYRVDSQIGDSATRETLHGLLRGDCSERRPAVLFTGTHGIVLEPDDLDIETKQGALLCGDWDSYRRVVRREHYFSADDVPDEANVHGLIHFSFACFGAGCPRIDGYAENLSEAKRQIAPKAFVARLPQRLLSHRNGSALAVLGHVDRAWTYSFHSENQTPQTQGFRDVLARILDGNRVGLATDNFDIRRAALSMELANVLLKCREEDYVVDDDRLARMVAARNDARDYVVLGDPAVRIRYEDLEAP